MNQKKKEVKEIRIKKFNVVLDEDGRNILEEDFSRDYTGMDRLDSPEKIVKIMEEVFHLSDKAEEYMYLICMTPYCRPICFFEVAHGTHDTAIVGIREIFVRVLLCGATDIVLVHNHPGSEPEPTERDSHITKIVKVAAELIGITFCDHIIISRGAYFSFSENGEMGKSIRK